LSSNRNPAENEGKGLRSHVQQNVEKLDSVIQSPFNLLHDEIELLMKFREPVIDLSIVGSIVCFQRGDKDSHDVILFGYGAQGLVVGNQMLPFLPKSTPVFALQAPEYNSKNAFFDYESRARFHFEEIIRSMDGKRIHLVGFSAGGYLVKLIADDLEKAGILFTITLIDPTPVVQINNDTMLTSNKLVRRRSLLRLVNDKLADALADREIIDEWHEDIYLFKVLGCDEFLANVVRKHLHVLESINESMACTMSRGSFLTKPLLCEQVGIFVLDSGFKFYDRIFEGIEYNIDTVYGWSKILQRILRLKAAGGHFDFFADATNVSALAEHISEHFLR
jgi:thioesterase domain-containing protein